MERALVLTSLVYPMDPARFLRDVWDKAPARFHNTRGFRRLVTLSDLETLAQLEGFRPDPDFLRTTRTVGRRKPEQRSVRDEHGWVSLPALYGAWADGFTIIVNGLHKRWPLVADLCRRLCAELRCPTGANLYNTPPGAQGFAAHFDTHDVFIVQLEGEKAWRVFPPRHQLPLEDMATAVDAAKLGRPLLSMTLRPGDVLYIPRGFIHDAVTSTTHSVHLTISAHQWRWVDMLKELVTSAAREDVRFREAVPLNGLPDAARTRMKDLLSSLQRGPFIERSVEQLQAQGIAGGPFVSDGHFVTLTHARKLTSHAVLERRPGMRCMVTREAGRATLKFSGNTVSGPAWIEPALRFIASHRVFAVREIPRVLSTPGKCVLARRLVREGFLTLHNATGAASWRRKSARRPRPGRRQRASRRRRR